MSIRLASASLLLLSLNLSAQGVVGELRTASNLGVFVHQGALAAFDTIPSGKLILPGSGRTVSAQASNSHMSTLVSFNNWPSGKVTADLSEQGGVSVGPAQRPASIGTTASAAGTPVQQGPHSVMLRLKGRPGAIGLIDTWATGGTSNTPSRVSGGYLLDVGNDGRIEFRADAIGHDSHSLVAKIPASGILMVKMTSNVKAGQTVAGGFAFKSGMSFRWSPAPFCVMRPYGEGCGPKLVGKAARSALNYDVAVGYSGGRPNAAALLILGLDRTAISIPGIRCLLLTKPAYTVPFRTDNNGNKTWGWRLPVQPYDVRLQAAELRVLTLDMSNALHFACYQ